MQESLSRSMKTPQTDVSAASPVILRALHPRTGAETRERVVVVAVNTGVVTAYSGKGEFLWQLRDAPTWAVDNRNASAVLFDVDARRVDDLGKHDNVHACVLITGEDRLSLVSRDGDVLASAYLPKKPIARPAMGDFDNDGISDIIVVTADAYLGYKVSAVSSPKGLLIALIILLVAAVAIFLLSMRSDFLIIDGIQQVNSNKRVFSLVRSTDEHID